MADLNATLGLSRLGARRGKSPTALVLLLAAGLFGRVGWAQFGGGTGTPDDPFLIYTAEQLNEIGVDSQNLNKHFKLMADIDLSGYKGTDFNIIGIGPTFGNSFSGVFDGNGRRIYNFTYTSADADSIGLFGFVQGKDARIKNLGLIDANIDAGKGGQVGPLVGRLDRGAVVTGCFALGGSVSGERDVGGLAGDVSEATITYSCSTASVSGRSYVGGLAGSYFDHVRPFGGSTGQAGAPSGHIISNCYATGTVSGRISAGGLVGQNWDGTITNCYATGSVSSESGWSLGGLVGFNFPGTITNCYSTGNVSGFMEVGGLVGANRDGTIANCYSTGAVTGTRQVGGLMGSNTRGTVSNCFWDRQRSGLTNMCGEQESGTGCDDGNARTTAQMQTENMFLKAGWDFVSESANGTEDVWAVCEGRGYPELSWQFTTGDFNGDNRVDMADFAFFAERWLSSDIGFFWCRGADLTGDGEVGFDDLKQFTDNWLAEGIPNPAAAVYLTIDDFESYNDLDPDDPESRRIFDVWQDGYDNPFTNGAVVGHAFPPYAERNIVYGGGQSMPYYYDALYKVARAELTLSPPQNWAEMGAEALSLWFYGDSINGVTPMSVVLNGRAAVYHDIPEATRIEAWTEWIIELKAFKGADLTNVSSIAICFGDSNNLRAGGTGLVFFDNIRLYGPG